MLEMFRRDQFKQDLADRAVPGGDRDRGAPARDRRAARGVRRATARGRRDTLHVRRSDPVGLALLRELRAPGRRRARRLVHQLRERHSRRRAVLRELRNRRACRERRRQRPGRRADDVPGRAGGGAGRAIPGRAELASRPSLPKSSRAHRPAPDAEGGECPRCGTPYEPHQEYCLECGLRLPVRRGSSPCSRPRGAGAFRRYPGDWVWPVLGLLIIAALGAAVAILATQDNGSATKTRAETSTSVPLSTATGTDHVAAEPARRRYRPRRADDGSGATASPAAVEQADQVARRAERLDDRALVDPAERGPRGRRQRRRRRP